ncbi:uncharacterized protein DUF2645 [Arcticibacter tournemirensis]|uniref:DUF2645 family protein n=1 Tax=Arcticibacter tournemirensis TaxID=699437 RepID=A0A5M9HMW2_9SPHI|nr:DUF4293 domain-containing protein [Arcticibacter tournemirensis]KAA8486708.1 DUF2645 family protein [Arcticibacter tournemirensis]TQM49246.1 uncharacterized protein DUF2645 [Arcticibacter tournemirensis]
MLQRIQTLWLFLSTTMIFALFLFPFLQILSANGTAKAIKVTGVYENIGGQVVQSDGFIGLTIATVLLGLLPFVVIFFYADRKKQIKLCYLTIVLIIGFSFWLAQTAKGIIGDMTIELQNYGIGVILPCLAIFFIVLALRGIRRDEKLIKSADRLR